MSRTWVSRLAGWLLPEDERGAATAGDLEELYASWRVERGGGVAALLAACELARSVPALMASGLAERGAKRLLARSVPAVVAGCLVLAVPFAIGGASRGLAAVAGRALVLVAGVVLAAAGGWVASAVAGAAARQHALGVGVVLATGAGILAVYGAIAPPLGRIVLWQVAIVFAASAGGVWYRGRRLAAGGGGGAGGTRQTGRTGTIGGIGKTGRIGKTGKSGRTWRTWRTWRTGRTGDPGGRAGGSRAGRGATPLLAVPLVLAAANCEFAPPSDDAANPVIRHFLSGESNDWEPTLTVAPDGRVHVLALRRITAPMPDGRRGEKRVVTWTSTDGGITFGPARAYPDEGGDPRMEATRDGTLLASWIRIEWDSAGGVDFERGGLELAMSRDGGQSWETTLAAPMASGVADKPELAISPDGREIFIAFMARGTLDVVGSSDGGATWRRYTADATPLTGHWPSGIALAPGGDLFVADAKQLGPPSDSILSVELNLLHSADGGATWDVRRISRSTRHADPGDCVHDSPCPVQIPYLDVATDARDGVYIVYSEGTAGQPYTLKFERSTDGGATWSSPAVLSESPRPASGGAADHFYPMVAAAGDGLVYVAWFDDRDGPIGVYAVRSTDGGRSWSPEVRLSPPEGLDGIYGEYGGIEIDDDGVLHVTWSDGVGHISRPGGRGGTWYARWDGRIP